MSMFESLESRRLLSGGVTVSQNGSAITVKGGSGASSINVVENNGNVIVEDLQAATPQIFAASGITAINILGQAGSDTIFYTGNTVGANISGNGGNDALTVSDKGSGASYVSGDGDDDQIEILAAHNTTVVGGGGADHIDIQSGADLNDTYLYGLGGDDTFTTFGGHNHIYGGGGDDTVFNFGGVNDYNSVETVFP